MEAIFLPSVTEPAFIAIEGSLMFMGSFHLTVKIGANDTLHR